MIGVALNGRLEKTRQRDYGVATVAQFAPVINIVPFQGMVKNLRLFFFFVCFLISFLVGGWLLRFL